MSDIVVVYSAQEFTQILMDLATNTGTKYKNSFPYNCGYYDRDNKFSFDCWCMVKAIIWGWYKNREYGYYCCEPGKNGMPDTTGAGIMAICTKRSTKFDNLVIGEFLLAPGQDHAGVYVGDFYDRNGNLCNVVECTTTWGENRVIGSWVDDKGLRYAYQGGPQDYSWWKHGRLPQIDYTKKPRHDVIDVDGWWGSETTLWTQKMLGCEIQDGIVSFQAKSDKPCLPRCTPYVEGKGGSWQFDYDKVGSNVIKAIQVLVGVDPDGHCGYLTVCGIQRFLAERGLYDGAIDGSMGPDTVKGWQTFVNDSFNK